MNYIKGRMIKKIVKWFLIIAMSLYISWIGFVFLFFYDNLRYKQIGDTHYYLLPNGTGQESLLCHDGGEDGMFFLINHEGLVHDVYWNHQKIIVKCSEQNKEHWYIINNINDYNYPEFHVKHFTNENDYRNAMDSLDMREENMEHTDGSVP